MSKIIISCPKCKHQQEEPSKVFSCYCKSCRTHLDIERDNVTWRHAETPANATLLSKLKALISKRPITKVADVQAPQRPSIRTGALPTSQPEESPLGAPASRKAAAKKVIAPAQTANYSVKNTPGEGRAPKFRSERILQCYACEKSFAASKLGPAPACPHCTTFFPSNDRVIEEPTSEDIFTYGNVRVLTRGALTTGKLRCHHLAAYGQLGGDIVCSGRVECNASGKMDATLRCRELIIPRKVKIEFTGVIEADQMEIQGEITACALINGELVVDSAGIFNGEVITRTLSVEDDAELNASVQIDTDPASLRSEFERPAVSN